MSRKVYITTEENFHALYTSVEQSQKDFILASGARVAVVGWEIYSSGAETETICTVRYYQEPFMPPHDDDEVWEKVDSSFNRESLT